MQCALTSWTSFVVISFNRAYLYQSLSGRVKSKHSFHSFQSTTDPERWFRCPHWSVFRFGGSGGWEYVWDFFRFVHHPIPSALIAKAAIDTLIPSESAINAAKEKRNRLRTTDQDDDYISLSLEKASDMPKGPHPESRLMREEDELGEGEDGMSGYFYIPESETYKLFQSWLSIQVLRNV